MKFKHTILSTILTFLIMFPMIVFAQNKDYEAGQKAMHKQQYKKAYKHFKAAQSDKKYTDAALYWQSYVLFKNKQDAKAKRVVEKLIKNHPNSKWIDDAEMLMLEQNLEAGLPNVVALEIELEKLEKLELNDELKLYTIQQLMFKDQVKGLTMVKDLLHETKDVHIKMNALQLLSINESEQATKELYEFVLQNQEKELQNQEKELQNHAVQMLSLRDSLKSNELLLKLYEKNANKELKSSIIQGFIHSDDHKKILKLIELEKDSDLSQQMIQLLGVMGAKEELKIVSKSIKGAENKAALVHALALSGDSQTIKDMIANSKDDKLKIEAIQSLIMVDDDMDAYLYELYSNMDVPELKQEVISVFVATGTNPKDIKKLIKMETNNELKLQLINTLMVMGEKDELLKVLEVENNPQAKLEIIQMLGIMGAADELKTLHLSSESGDVQLQVIQALALDDSNDNEEFLNKAYKSENNEVKHSVIQAYMIKGNTQALVNLLKQETDDELKKEILRSISTMDPEYLLNRIEESNKKGEMK